jgi:hypothetical protein
MFDVVIYDADTDEEIIPSLKMDIKPSVGESVHYWVTHFPRPDGEKIDIEIIRLRHDIRHAPDERRLEDKFIHSLEIWGRRI